MQTYLTSLDSFVKGLTDQYQLDGDGISEMLGSYQDMMSNVSDTVSKALPQILDVGVAVGNGVISGITAVISSVYMLAGKGRLVPQLKKIMYATRIGCWKCAARPTVFLWALSMAN